MAKFAAVVAIFGQGVAAAFLRSSRQTDHAALEAYTFDEFSKDFGKEYKKGSPEHQRRLALFQEAVERVQATNARNAKEGRPWRAGRHEFMDWTVEERNALNGYKPNRARAQSFSFEQSGARAFNRLGLNSTMMSVDLDQMTEGGILDYQSGPPIRNQGNCGSCWAISASEALEAQLQKSGAFTPDQKVSAQALVDCVPNPQHCGGSGGCDGATGELAYSFVRDHGIPLEDDLPYNGQTGQCTPSALTGVYPGNSRVRASGWNALPSNQAKPLMQALVQQGPAVVAVDANTWFDYSHGVFDGCDKDATIVHAVLAKGFGKDATSGHNFWLIQNSWGHGWGESGHIRLLRRDDDDNYCGTDRKPKEGLGCDGGPSEVTVCGMCGVLFDSLVPEGVRIEQGDGATASPEQVASAVMATASPEQAALPVMAQAQDVAAQMKEPPRDVAGTEKEMEAMLG